MINKMISTELEILAYECAKECVQEGMVIAERIHKDKTLWNEIKKEDESPVTLADYCVQYMIMSKLKSKFPDISIVAEEDASILTKELYDKLSNFLGPIDLEILRTEKELNSSPEYFWALDPIDGTRGFLIQGGQYCICLALLKKRVGAEVYDPIIGVLGCPLLEGGKLLHSYVPQYKENPIKTIACESLRVTVPRVRNEMSNLAVCVNNIIPLDSQCKYALLVLNRADVYYRPLDNFPTAYREKIWDHAPGVAILRADGGEARDFTGHPICFHYSPFIECKGGIVASRDGIDVADFIEK